MLNAMLQSARSAMRTMQIFPSEKQAEKDGSGKNHRVRGVAMNPVDHPMGGGEGRSSGRQAPLYALG